MSPGRLSATSSMRCRTAQSPSSRWPERATTEEIMVKMGLRLDPGGIVGHVTRRAAIRGVAGGMASAFAGVGGFGREGTAAQSETSTPAASPVALATLSDATLRDFEADVEAAMQTFPVPGAAVALVQGEG